MWSVKSCQWKPRSFRKAYFDFMLVFCCASLYSVQAVRWWISLCLWRFMWTEKIQSEPSAGRLLSAGSRTDPNGLSMLPTLPSTFSDASWISLIFSALTNPLLLLLILLFPLTLLPIIPAFTATLLSPTFQPSGGAQLRIIAFDQRGLGARGGVGQINPTDSTILVPTEPDDNVGIRRAARWAWSNLWHRSGWKGSEGPENTDTSRPQRKRNTKTRECTSAKHRSGRQGWFKVGSGLGQVFLSPVSLLDCRETSLCHCDTCRRSLRCNQW